MRLTQCPRSSDYNMPLCSRNSTVRKESVSIYVETIVQLIWSPGYLATYFNTLLIATFSVAAWIVIDASEVWALPFSFGTDGHL